MSPTKRIQMPPCIKCTNQKCCYTGITGGVNFTYSIKYISPCSVKAISQLLGSSPNSSSSLSICSLRLCSSSSNGDAFNVVAVMVDLFLALFPGAEGLAPGRRSLDFLLAVSWLSSVWCLFGPWLGGYCGGLGVP